MNKFSLLLKSPIIILTLSLLLISLTSSNIYAETASDKQTSSCKKSRPVLSVKEQQKLSNIKKNQEITLITRDLLNLIEKKVRLENYKEEIRKDMIKFLHRLKLYYPIWNKTRTAQKNQ